MKIKLNRVLWNHKAGEIIEVGEYHGTWAVNKGYAEQVIESIKHIEAKSVAENKAIEPEYKQRGRKPKNR